MQIVDANIVLRYLLADNEALTEQAASIIDHNSIHLPVEVLCEVVYVLEKVYKVPREDICNDLSAFLSVDRITVPYCGAILLALRYYAAEKLDFVDCILAGYAQAEHAQIHTFDKALQKLLKR